MILPRPHTDRGRQQVVAWAGSFVLMTGLYAGLRGTPLPAIKSSSAAIRQLDPLFVERFTAPPPLDLTPDPEKADEPPPPTTAARASLEQEVGTAIDELAQHFGTAPARALVSGKAAGGGPAQEREEAPGAITADPEAGRFAELFGGAGDIPVTAARPRPRAVAEGARRGGIEVGARVIGADTATPEPAVTPPTVDLTVEAPTARARSTGVAANVVIKEYQPQKFNAVAVDRLAAWLRDHPADLPVGVRVHLHHQPAFLTAAVPLTSRSRILELYLMYNPTLRELHIVLVEGERSVYLIDRGFQEQSRSLREGTVRRLKGEIVAVNSQAGAPSSDRAREFYNIFLSWWEAARADGAR